MSSGSFPGSSRPGTGSALVDDNEDRSRPPLLSLFFAFQIIGGHIGFPILLAVVLVLRNASSRHPLFINFCVIWIMSSVVFCILLYAGHDTGPEPPFMICAIQASLVYAMPIMSSVSLTAMVFHLWLVLRGVTTQKFVKNSKKMQRILVALPYLVALPFIIFPATVASIMPQRVSRRQTDFGFYCATNFKPLRTTVAVSVAISLVFLLVCECLVGLICYKSWRSVRAVRVYGWTSASLIVRIGIFTLYIIVGLVACMVAIAFPNNRFRILFQASLPTTGFLILGTRPTLWRRDPNTSVSTHTGWSGNSSNSPSASFPTVRGSTKSSATTRSRSYSTDLGDKQQVERASTVQSKHSRHSIGWDFRDTDSPEVPFSKHMRPRDEPRPELDAAQQRDAEIEKGIQEEVLEEALEEIDTKPVVGHPTGWI